MNKILGGALVGGIILALLFGVYAYGVYEQQRLMLDLVRSKASSQQQMIDQLRQDIDALNLKVEAQEVPFKLAVPKIEEVQKELSVSRASVSDMEQEFQSFKKEDRSWQKEYVATLLKIEVRLDEIDKSFAGFESELAQSILPELHQQIDILKKQLSTVSPQGFSTTQPTPSQRSAAGFMPQH